MRCTDETLPVHRICFYENSKRAAILQKHGLDVLLNTFRKKAANNPTKLFQHFAVDYFSGRAFINPIKRYNFAF